MFYRSTRFGHSAIIYSITGGGQVEFFLGIRHHLIEEVLKSLFGNQNYYGTYSHTILPSWSHLIQESQLARISCENLNDLRSAGDKFINFMDRTGFDFLDHYRSLANLDFALNDRPSISATWANHNYQRCFRAMTSAKIRSRTDYDQVYHMHRQYLEKRGYSGEIIHKFDTTFVRLKSISLN
jgi:hypothetical protein